jgi:hypothetical protein
VLGTYVGESLEQVREISADWMQEYNEERLHDAPDRIPPAHVRGSIGDQNFSFERVSLTGKRNRLSTRNHRSDFDLIHIGEHFVFRHQFVAPNH